eukprot:gene6378-13720_t
MGKGTGKGDGGCSGKPVKVEAPPGPPPATTEAPTDAGDDPAKYGPYDSGDAAHTLTLAAKITANEKGRAWFAHGLAWIYGYNHEEGIACMMKAAAADPDCAMAHWAIAYSLSSSYNWSPGLGCGYDSIQTAVGLKDKCNDLEKDLIDALATRSSKDARDGADPTKLNFGNPPELNVAFAAEMAKLAAKYPEDLDVQAIYCEGVMNIKPWALWDRKVADGKLEITPADDNTLLVKKCIEAAFKIKGGDTHPALCHLYCHLMELSPNPEEALPAANTLRTLMPAMGHLVHMPSHIDAWVGGYEEGIACNEAGTAADDRYVEISGNESQFYKFYRMHNQHFVVWMSMQDAQYANSMKYARKMEAQLTREHVTFMLAGVIPMGAVFLEAFATMPWHVMIRFGKWDDIIAEPVQTDKDAYPGCIATAHYARGIAYGSKGMLPEAEAEEKLFLDAMKNPALAGRVMHNNVMFAEEGPCVLRVAEAMLRGEIMYRKAVFDKGDAATFDAAFDQIKVAVTLSENLKYDEPWGWMVPVRHALGALMLEQGRFEDAEKVYRDDIALWKDNVWGLLGLTQVSEKSGKPLADIDDLTAKFKKASKRADISLDATCFCAQEAGAACCAP